MGDTCVPIPVIRGKRRGPKDDYAVRLSDRDWYRLCYWLRDLAVESKNFKQIKQAVRLHDLITPQLGQQGFQIGDLHTGTWDGN